LQAIYARLCNCGAINEEKKLQELNVEFTNSYFCPGGFRKNGRYSPAHIEPGSSIHTMTSIAIGIDKIQCYKKLWKKAEHCLDLAREAEPELWKIAESMNQERLIVIHFLDFFLCENIGKFCHQVPIPEFEDWIVTSVDAMNGASLPYSRKILPPNLQINGIKFQKKEIQNLIDLRNAVLWDLGVFYGQN